MHNFDEYILPLKTISQLNERFWFTLDNAAKIFPAIISEEIPVVFRLTVVLKQPVKIDLFRKAVLIVEKRFPYYKVQLKEGFFWFYLEHLPRHIPVEVDEDILCRRFSRGEILVRFLVRESRISVEFSHIITDGGGGTEFLKTILIEYSKLLGTSIPDGYAYIKPDSPLSDEEYEDAYNRYFKEDIPPMIKRSKAFHLPFPLNSKPRFRQSLAIISLENIKKVAGSRGVSITVFLVSVYLYVLQEISESLPQSSKFRKNKKLRIQVPIDLRNVYKTKTMRNFSLFLMPEIDLRLGHYTFDEILKSVFHQMQLEADEKLINKNISRNVASEKKLYVRGIPLFLKSIILRAKYYALGTSQYSGVITNLGKKVFPDGVNEIIDYLIVIPPPPNKMLKMNCAVVGFGEKLILSFGNITKSSEFEEKFGLFLRSQGIYMEVET